MFLILLEKLTLFLIVNTIISSFGLEEGKISLEIRLPFREIICAKYNINNPMGQKYYPFLYRKYNVITLHKIKTFTKSPYKPPHQ